MSPPTPESFPLQIVERLRYGDTDRQGHVNNAVYATLFESGRVSVLYDPARALPPEGCEFVLARIGIDFLRELNWPGDVIVGSAVTRIGRSSATLAQAIFRDGEAVATAESVVVLMDSAARRATPLPEAARAALTACMAPGAA